MLTSPTVHVSVLGASVLANLHARRQSMAAIAAPRALGNKPVSRGALAGVFMLSVLLPVALAVWLNAL